MNQEGREALLQDKDDQIQQRYETFDSFHRSRQ